MRQLTGLDASFLSLETPTMFAHVAHLVICDAPDGPFDATFERVKTFVDQRLHVFPAYRQRIVEVPFGLDHPYWLEDPDFDLEFHVRRLAVPSPGNREQLAELVAEIMSRPLDRRHPLWEMYLIEGLQDGRLAWLNKIHHCAMDGSAGADLLVNMLDRTPDADQNAAAGNHAALRPWKPEREPSAATMLWLTSTGLLTSPVRAARLSARTLRMLGVIGKSGKLPFGWGSLPFAGIRQTNRDALPVPGPPLIAPRVSFNATITPHRRFAFRSIRIAEVKEIKNAFGTTLNDVVLATCAGALRTYLSAHDELPDQPLVALVPVSVHEPGATKVGNRISALWAPLPVQEPDPVERLRLISGAMANAKSTHNAIGADLLQDFANFATPAIAGRAARLSFRTRMGNKGRPIWNLVISNVPGPNYPLYLAGIRMRHWYPVSIVNDAAGLNITVHSYEDRLDYGLISCRELVPDLWRLMDYLLEAHTDLLKAAREKPGLPSGTASPAPDSGMPLQTLP